MNVNSRWLQAKVIMSSLMKGGQETWLLPIFQLPLRLPTQFLCGLTILLRILNRSFWSFGSSLDVSKSAKVSAFSGDRLSGFSPPYNWTSIDRHLDETSKISGSSLGSWKLTNRTSSASLKMMLVFLKNYSSKDRMSVWVQTLINWIFLWLDLFQNVKSNSNKTNSTKSEGNSTVFSLIHSDEWPVTSKGLIIYYMHIYICTCSYRCVCVSMGVETLIFLRHNPYSLVDIACLGKSTSYKIVRNGLNCFQIIVD